MNPSPSHTDAEPIAVESGTEDFASRVLDWFDVHGRKDLPWQHDITPYRVWVSEIMLQQTQVATVIPYYERFMTSFPTVETLARAEIDAVLQHWTGLGYYARARNLHKAAVRVVEEFDGQFPTTVAVLETLPGIGRSTAGAIASIAGGQRAAILDGNVKRVLARHDAIPGWPGNTAVMQALWARSEAVTPHHRVADYTQAIMDLGATLCTRSRPGCDRCPVAASCTALKQQAQSAYPGKKPRKAMPVKETVMILAKATSASGHTALLLERRPEDGIWGGLWSFPECPSLDDGVAWLERRLGLTPGDGHALTPLRHTFSHFHLDIQPVVYDVGSADRQVRDDDTIRWVELDADLSVGVPKPVLRIFEQLIHPDPQPQLELS